VAYGVPRSVRERYSEFENAHGPTLTWLQQFSVRTFISYFSSFWLYGDNKTNVWFCLCRLIT
jgi:hypothetical protein